MDATATELELRLRAEEVVAFAAFGPVAEVMAELDAFDAAASAAAGCGLLPAARATALVEEVVDALVVRGATWLDAVVPELDVSRLYDVAVAGRQPLLRRVLPVAATVGGETITSVELWSDRAVARVVGHDGAVAASHVTGAAGVDDRRLDLRDGAGGAVGIDLTGGRAARESPGEILGSSVERHLAAVLTLAVAEARRDPDVAVLNAARGRIAAAASLVAPSALDDLLHRFDEEVAPLLTPPGRPATFLLEVVPVAQHFFGGWLLSLEQWSDQWRAVVVEEDPTIRSSWTATDSRGQTYGATRLAVDVLRFDPPLPLGWTSLRLERHLGAEVLVLEVTR